MMITELQQTNTTCPYCGVGCGVTVQYQAGEISPTANLTTAQTGSVQPVAGMQAHPANFGRLCVKGSALHETIDHTDRLLYPTMNGKRTSWDKALSLVADKIQQVIHTHGPDAVAFYGSGQLLTEDYYVANKLMKGFIGSANMDTNSRLCMASAVASYKRSLGSDTVPGNYEDLEKTDLLIMVGSNAAWAHPILFQRIVAAKKANPAMKVVVIDPRRTATCDIADLHLAIRPGSDTFLFNALLTYMDQSNALDYSFIHNHTDGIAEALESASASSATFEELAQPLDVSSSDLNLFFEWFRDTPKTVTFYSQGVNQSSAGTDKANAIINLHLATGRIGKEGASPFSITGQPNAMGGREVGGLANQLAAHMDFSAAERDLVRRFWQAPTIAERPGHKAVDLFNAVKEGKIKFLWIMSTNPLVSMPDADDVKEAMKRCELVVVSDCMANTDTTAAAHVLLPAASWGEKNGTVTNSERRISRQRGFLPSPGEAMPDWWIISQVGRRLGHEEAFNYEHASDVFDEHARLSAFENNGKRDFDLSGLVGMSRSQYDALAPIQWPVNDQYPSGRARFFDDGHFYTATGKAKFINVEARLPEVHSQGDLVMNTGRIRDHWHTMTRTAKSARLGQHIAEPYADIHPDDANLRGIKHGDLVEIHNERGHIIVRAQVINDGRQRKGELFVPMHWTNRYASKARMGTLIAKTTDPISGQPELKFTQVNARPFNTAWQGFILSRKDLGPLPADYWIYGVTETGHGYEIADRESPLALIETLKARLPEGDWITLSDPSHNHYRLALLTDGRLQAVIFIHQNYDFGARQWLIERFNDETLSANDRKALLAGRPLGKQADKGAIICSCFQVGENTIKNSIQQGCSTAEALGEALKCGTNCGSCIPELKALIQREALATNAADAMTAE
ncbi:nitrate reductase [Thalassolituus oleivorans]|nr:nitrate reductase [Thalassolituus oleivorans]